MKLTYNENAQAFVFVGRYEDRLIPKEAGFWWNQIVPRAWATKDPRIAKKLMDHADELAKAKLEEVFGRIFAAVDASKAVDAEGFEPKKPPHLQYFPFQKAGIKYAIDHGGIALIADEMGLGKTIQAIGLINELEPASVLVVCPASLKLMWKRQLTEWLVRPRHIEVAPSDMLMRGDVVVINYDLLHKYVGVCEKQWDMVILDEAHYAKNPSAKRTKAVLSLKAKYRIALTGTPILNRPIEIQPILQWLRPDVPIFKSRFKFALRYCNAHQTRWGWDLNGASNLGELQNLLRAECMVRRLKKDVLTELPPKVRQVLEIPPNGAQPAVDAEWAAYRKVEEALLELQRAALEAQLCESMEEYKAAIAALQQGYAVAFAEMSQARLDVARAKLPHIIEYLEESVSAEHPIVCFAHHIEIIEALYTALSGKGIKCGYFHGGVSIERRQELVDAFQKSELDLLILQLKTGGTGITLTRSSHVVFAELDWTPANLQQAEDRCHRIGQKDSVLVQHIVLAGSLDAYMAKKIIEKQSMIDRALDQPGVVDADADVPMMLDIASPSEESPTRAKVDKLAARVNDASVALARRALQIIASYDKDRAMARNSMGFGKIDTRIGHKLVADPNWSDRQAAMALLLAYKYRRQLPEDLRVEVENVAKV